MIDPNTGKTLAKLAIAAFSLIIFPIARDYIKDEIKLRQQARWRKREKEEDERQKRLREL